MRLMLAFCAGAISMLLFLTPGDIDYKGLLDKEKRAEMINFDKAVEKVEKIPGLASYYACQAEKYIRRGDE